MNSPTHADQCNQLLKCKHCVGNNCKTYYMACHVIKEMSQKRVKVIVFGDRYWKRDQNKMKIRYVDKIRIFNRSDIYKTLDEFSDHEFHDQMIKSLSNDRAEMVGRVYQIPFSKN